MIKNFPLKRKTDPFIKYQHDPATFKSEVDCWACEGTGKIVDRKKGLRQCVACEGNGKIKIRAHII